jgi:hypothetical protein
MDVRGGKVVPAGYRCVEFAAAPGEPTATP